MKKKESRKIDLFISHAGTDITIKGKNIPASYGLTEAFRNKGKRAFLSSEATAGLKSGENIWPGIKENVANADVFVVIITNNFLRSPYCIFELGLIKALPKKEVHYFYASNDIALRMNSMLGQEDTNFHILSGKIDGIMNNIFAKGNETRLSNLLKEVGGKELFRALLKHIKIHTQRVPCQKPYIGQTEDERKFSNAYMENVGITRLARRGIYQETELRHHVTTAEEVYCVSTTGAALLKVMKEDILPHALLKPGFEFHMIIPSRDSDFCNDVARAECYSLPAEHAVNIQNKRRIFNEYEATIQYLNEAYIKAQRLIGEEKPVPGKILIHNSRTLLRQTILLTVKKRVKKRTIWGWLSATMVPIRSVDSPDMLFECFENEEGKLGDVVLTHCKCIAQLGGDGYKIDGQTEVEDIELAFEDNRKHWQQIFEAAKPANPQGPTLIEIAAQHPLENGVMPGVEFTARLNEAIRLYRQLKSEDPQRIVKLFVPGSLHCENGQCDSISLAQAGINFLQERLNKDEAKDILTDEETNLKYMDEKGVYNSLDECYVASEIYKNDIIHNSDQQGQILCVCAPNQVMRKTLAYLRYGLEVMCYSVPVPGKTMYHNPIYEYFINLHQVTSLPTDWQDPDNVLFIKSRKDRKC